MPFSAAGVAVVPAGLEPNRPPSVGIVVVVGAVVAAAPAAAGVLVVAGVTVAVLANRLEAAAGAAELGVAVPVVAGFVPNKPPDAAVDAGVPPNSPEAGAADEAASVVVVLGAGNRELVAVGVEVDGAAVAAGVAPVVAPVVAPNNGLVAAAAGVAAPDAGVVVAAPNNDGVPEAGAWAGLAPKSPLLPAVAPVVACGWAAVEAGVVVFWPKSPPAPAAGVAAGLAPRPAPPNRFAAGFEASAGGAPAGVVEPRVPKSGFAGVTWAPPAPAAGEPLPNRPAPAPAPAPPPPKRPPVVGVVADAAGAALDTAPKRPPAGVLVAGAAVVAAGFAPKRLGVPDGAAAPDAGVEVLPNMLPAELLPPPNRFPPAAAPDV